MFPIFNENCHTPNVLLSPAKINVGPQKTVVASPRVIIIPYLLLETSVAFSIQEPIVGSFAI